MVVLRKPPARRVQGIFLGFQPPTGWEGKLKKNSGAARQLKKKAIPSGFRDSDLRMLQAINVRSGPLGSKKIVLREGPWCFLNAWVGGQGCHFSGALRAH